MTGSSREFYGTGTNFFRYRYRYFFPGPIFSGTGSFSGTNFFRYRDRYFFPGPNFSGTGTIQKGAKFPGPGIPGTGMSHSDAYCIHPILKKPPKMKAASQHWATVPDKATGPL